MPEQTEAVAAPLVGGDEEHVHPGVLAPGMLDVVVTGRAKAARGLPGLGKDALATEPGI